MDDSFPSLFFYASFFLFPSTFDNGKDRVNRLQYCSFFSPFLRVNSAGEGILYRSVSNSWENLNISDITRFVLVFSVKECHLRVRERKRDASFTNCNAYFDSIKK